MRILFIGTVDFSLKALEKLIEMEIDIVGVCTKIKSEFNADYSDLSTICKKKSIPCRYVEDINSPQSLHWIRELRPDLIYCFGWSYLIKKDLLNIPKLGVVGFHPAELPHNRGRHPIIWALALGLSETASTFFLMDEGADTGDIISQEKISIDKTDDAKKLYDKITDVALRQIESFTREVLKKRKFTHLVKQDKSEGNTWRKRGPKDGCIDFRMNTKAIINLIRALTRPYVGAHLLFNGKPIKVWKAEPVALVLRNLESGKVIEVNERKEVTVKTYDAAIKITEHTFTNLPKEGEYL